MGVAVKVNKSQLEEILGVSHVTLTEWQEQGLPIEVRAERKGQSHTYETKQVIDWMIQRELNKANAKETARDRLARMQGDMVELDLLTKRGLLVPVEQIEPAWTSMVAAAKSYLRQEPDRLTHLLNTMESVDAKRDLLAETFDEFLRKLSTYDPSADDDSADSTASSATEGVL